MHGVCIMCICVHLYMVCVCGAHMLPVYARGVCACVWAHVYMMCVVC